MRRLQKPEAFLPYGRQQIDEADIDAVTEVLRGDWLTTGPAIERFEKSLAQRVGAQFAISCNSGTAALHLACLTLDLGPRSAAIVPSITFLATANAVRMTGAEVVFADVDPDNGLLTAASLREAFDRADAAGLRVKAVFPVHLAGQCPELAAIAAVARARGAAIVEDACHALGTYHACPDGSAAPVGACRLTDMAIFSFHPVKAIACGEGGAVTTNDPEFARRMARLRSHGMYRETDEIRHPELGLDADGAANPWYYEMAEIGWNYRLSDIHAALAASQLAKLDHFIEERRALAQRYDDMLAPLGRLAAPIRRSRGCLPAWHLYAVLVDFEALGVDRADLMIELRQAGIGTQVHYIPVHRQPYYRDRAPDLLLAGAEEYYRRTLSLPLFVGMMPADVRRVVGALHNALLRSARAAS